MAIASGRPTTALKSAAAAPAEPARKSVEQRLFAAGPTFNFFQAVRLLENLHPDREPVGYDGPVGARSCGSRRMCRTTFLPAKSMRFAPTGPAVCPR